MRFGLAAVSLSVLVSLTGAASPSCPEWMTDTQCAQYVEVLQAPSSPRIAPLIDSGGSGCVQNPSAFMCAYATSRSQANWHWCPDSSRDTRCDLKWCEPNDCWNTNCTVTSTAYCCAKAELKQPPDWSTTEVTACPML